MPNPRLSRHSLDSLEDFLRELHEISEEVSGMLEEWRGNEIDFRVLKGELSSLANSVKLLSTQIKGDPNNLSILTRMTVLEEKLENLQEEKRKLEEEKKKWQEEKQQYQKKHDDEKEEKRIQQVSLANIEIADKTGKWQFKLALATGVFALLTSVIHVIIKIIFK